MRPNFLRRYEKYIPAEDSSAFVVCLWENVTHRSLDRLLECEGLRGTAEMMREIVPVLGESGTFAQHTHVSDRSRIPINAKSPGRSSRFRHR